MLSASESVNCTELFWTVGVAGPNWPVVICPTVLPAPVLNRLTPNRSGRGAIHVGEPHAQQDLRFGRRHLDAQQVHHFAQRGRHAGGALGA